MIATQAVKSDWRLNPGNAAMCPLTASTRRFTANPQRQIFNPLDTNVDLTRN